MKKYILIWVLTAVFALTMSGKVHAQEMGADNSFDTSIFDFSDIEDVINDNDYNIDFESTMKELASGESEGIFLELFTKFFNGLLGEIIYNKEIVIKIILMAISLALINNLSAVFKNGQISETGFFAIYCMIITVLISGFVALSQMVMEALEMLLNFMTALIPSLMLAIGFTGAYTSQSGFCQLILIAITVVEKIMLVIILPAINIYVVLMLVNSLVNEDYISKLAGLIDSFVKWFIKTMLGVFTGMNLIQTMILPAIDGTKINGLQKITGMVPGANVATDMFIGTGNIIKNAIGTTALVFIVVIVAVPIIKILAFSAMYRVTGALIQPVSDKRVVKAVDSVAKGAGLLYKTVTFCAVLFGLSIAIMCIATNNLG